VYQWLDKLDSLHPQIELFSDGITVILMIFLIVLFLYTARD